MHRVQGPSLIKGWKGQVHSLHRFQLPAVVWWTINTLCSAAALHSANDLGFVKKMKGMECSEHET